MDEILKLDLLGTFIDMDWNVKFSFEEIPSCLKFVERHKDKLDVDKIMKTFKTLKENASTNNLIDDSADNDLMTGVELIELRNLAFFDNNEVLFETFKTHSKKYLNNYYEESGNIYNDMFMEIEYALDNLKHIKEYEDESLLIDYPIANNEYHEDIKNLIYIYSLFDKIATLIMYFNPNMNDNKKYYFNHLIREGVVEHLNQSDLFIEKTKIFQESKLFKDFKNIRNIFTHNHVFPFATFNTKLYVFAGLFLLVYFAVEILQKHYTHTENYDL